LQEQIEALRLVDSDLNGDRREGLQRLIKMECDQGNWDSALVNCYELKRLAEKTKDTPRHAFALYHLGKIEIAQNRWDEALESHLGALEKYMEAGDRRGVSETNRSMGVIYGNKGDRSSAKRCFENSLETARTVGDKELQAKAEGNLAIMLDMEGRTAEAEEAHKNCLRYFLEIGDNPGVARTSNNLGVLCLSRDSFKEASGFFETAIESCRPTMNHAVLGIALVNAGHCYAKLGEVGKAISRTDESMAIIREPNDLNLLAHAFRNYGLIEFRNSNFDKASEWFEKSIRTAIGSGVEDTLASCYYEYGMALIEASVDMRLAKKMLKKASSLFKDLGNLQRASLVEKRLTTA
jgi:tetratricopeptide (TPR) repeat protein